LVEEALRDLLNKYQAKKGRLPKSKLTQMQKKDIAQRIHQEAAISEEEAATLLNWILELFKSTPQKGEPVSIVKFGMFTVRNKAPRRGRNPRTGEEVMISPRRVVTFRASSLLKTEVNSIQGEKHEAVTRTEKKGPLPKGKQTQSRSLRSDQGVLSFLTCGSPTIEPRKEKHRGREQYPVQSPPKHRHIYVPKGS
jgi:integration host factor subunit alpha